MLSLADIARSAVSLTKNMVSDQTQTSTTICSGTPAFDATYGYGKSTAATVVVCMTVGGFNDQRVTATMRYRAPTTAGAEYMGVMARFQTFDNASYQNYYFLRQNAGTIKLSKCLASSFTNIATSAYALNADEDAVFTLSCVGSAISGSIYCARLGTVNLSGTDTGITGGGLMGFRTLSQVGYCSTITVEQL